MVDEPVAVAEVRDVVLQPVQVDRGKALELSSEPRAKATFGGWVTMSSPFTDAHAVVKAQERSPTASGLQGDDELAGSTSPADEPSLGDAIEWYALKVDGVAIPSMLDELSKRRPRHVRRDDKLVWPMMVTRLFRTAAALSGAEVPA